MTAPAEMLGPPLVQESDAKVGFYLPNNRKDGGSAGSGAGTLRPVGAVRRGFCAVRRVIRLGLWRARRNGGFAAVRNG